MMKRIISLVLAVVFAAGVFSLEAAYAAGGSELPEIPIEPPETKYFKGVKKEDKTFKITGYTGKDSVIAVPSRKYGLVVTEIGDGAFKGLNITGVTVPDSVTAVGAGAFEDCVLLERATFADSVTSIGGGAFKNCNALTEFSVPAGVTLISEGTFSGCSSLKKVSVPAGVTDIAAGAFEGCAALCAVYFAGTRAQWEKVKVEAEGNGALLDAPVCCSDDDGHLFRVVTAEPTCAEDGYKALVCVDCGERRVTEVREALGHEFGEWTETAAPTCTAEGSETRNCSRCGAVDVRPVAALGHDYKVTETVGPTCTEGGYSVYTCSRCGDVYADDRTDALGHDFGEWGTAIAPTCTEKGVERRACSRCGESEEREVPAAGHDWGQWTEVTPATETGEGLERRVCLTDPAHFEERAIPKKSHVHTAEEIPGADASCTADGVKAHFRCNGCGRLFADAECAEMINSEDVEIPALGHDLGEWTVTAPATCSEGGSEERVCSRCGEKETRTVEPTGHKYIEAITEPTCTEKGFTTHTCVKCGDSYTDAEVAAPGHDFGTDGKGAACSRCGAKNPAVPAVRFTDVPEDAFYAFPVGWAVENGITEGTSGTTFSPNAPCTRCQVVTFLWRAAGKPEPKGSDNPFRDVKDGDYFCKAVLWAAENGITTGTTETAFSPDAPCTRGQIVTFLWRAAGKPEPKGPKNPFRDVKSRDYFCKAVLWAAENGITAGTTATTFSPGSVCTRGQAVTFLYRAR
ncbi:MAG: S-layer homology domain-containing protein [Clostridia bacterium]|nr:S-layer homology domain-containing protein [Clostridia bacterium]